MKRVRAMSLFLHRDNSILFLCTMDSCHTSIIEHGRTAAKPEIAKLYHGSMLIIKMEATVCYYVVNH